MVNFDLFSRLLGQKRCLRLLTGHTVPVLSAEAMPVCIPDPTVELLQELKQLLSDIRQQLPQPPSAPDFSANAWVWQHGALQAIPQPHALHLDDLLGVTRQKQQLVQNTRQFLAGLPANHVLLTGARGTGKSSLVRALLTDFAAQGLRVIEVARDDLLHLPQIRAWLRGRPEKFIVYCDDLAFNSENEQYRALKSVLDGSLQSEQDNLLIYATSNRRHLLPEFMHENDLLTRKDPAFQDEVHPQEAIEEKVSLSDRFGLWLPFHPMNQDTYLSIVAHWISQAGLSLDADARREAIRWEMTRGQRSGRSAAQFARHWIGLQQLKPQDV